ncbi:MAG TPA: hypothetical protein VHE30_09205 [Polyangiaceae bacterium]|nr:hypothetical protein [Polyangiaceae bacterium]
MDPKALLERAMDWLRSHPEDVVQAVKNVAALRATVPLEALRVLAASARGSRAPKDVEIEAAPPGLRIGATVTAMKTDLRIGATLYIDAVQIASEELRLVLRLRELSVSVIGASDTPVAAFIRSGALNLSQPGKLVANLPKKPTFVLEADGDRIVLDLMREPKIASRLRKPLSFLTPLVTVTGVESSGDILSLQLSCLPDGLGSALAAVRAAI